MVYIEGNGGAKRKGTRDWGYNNCSTFCENGIAFMLCISVPFIFAPPLPSNQLSQREYFYILFLSFIAQPIALHPFVCQNPAVVI